MVSFPDDRESRHHLSLRPRDPTRSESIASSSRASMSTVRRSHRHARSHAGGSGTGGGALQNEFPCFLQTGDVEVVISNGRKEQRYVLHRLSLSRCSGFFETSLSDEWNQAGPSDESTGAPTSKRWRYELDWGRGGDDIPMLVKKPVSTSSIFGSGSGDHTSRPPPLRPKPPAPSNGFFRSMANFTSLNVSQHQPEETDPDDEIFRTYDNLFRIFYHYPPQLDSVNIAQAYVESKSLLQLADMYDALEVVGQRIDHHLLRFHGRLWKQIAKYPPSYLKLGYLAKSRAIFAEAMVHVVGQWPAGKHQLHGQVPQAVLELIEDKVDELEEVKARVEGKLWRLTLTTTRGERVAPANAWLDWQMMSLWRQWFAENTTPQPTSILKPPGSSSSHHRGSSRDSRNGPSARASSNALATTSNRQGPPPPVNTGRIFRLIGSAGSNYLGHDDVKRFLKNSPELYHRDTIRRAERRLEELKNLARDAVKPLMRNFLELDPREAGMGYLVCTKMEDRDWDMVFGED
jgi:hypothetical protein